MPLVEFKPMDTGKQTAADLHPKRRGQEGVGYFVVYSTTFSLAQDSIE